MRIFRVGYTYKFTVSNITQCNKYPVPKTADFLAALNVGERFLKLDLSHAYHQFVLNKSSRKYLTINTHKDLFQPILLQYGIHSVAGIF